MKVAITEADIRAALESSLPFQVHIPDVLLAVRRAALQRQLDEAHTHVERLAEVSISRAKALDDRGGGDVRRWARAREQYDVARAASDRAERRARELYDALMATFNREAPR